MQCPARQLYSKHTGTQRLAWIVGLNAEDCTGLAMAIQKSGYTVDVFSDYKQFSDKITHCDPSIVFIAPSAAELNDIEVSTQIRNRFESQYTGVVFLTREVEEEFAAIAMLADCDDILDINCDAMTLNLVLRRTERIRTLQCRNQLLSAEIEQHNQWIDDFYNDWILAKNEAVSLIRRFDTSGQASNTDFVMSRYSLSGELCVLFGAFIEPSIVSKIACQMVSDVFHAMLSKGFSIAKIANTLNKKILGSLPGKFTLAAQLIAINAELEQITAINFGSNSILLFDGATTQLKSKVGPASEKLGAVADLNVNKQVTRHSITVGDRLVLGSDSPSKPSLIDQESSGIIYKEPETPEDIKIIAHSLGVLRQENNGDSQPSLLCITVSPAMFGMAPGRQNESEYRSDSIKILDLDESWQYQLRLNGSSLGKNNPVPSIMSQIQEFENLGDQYQSLFTILTELYMNAIDHGILKLDSQLKNSSEGFEYYFNERDKRLGELTEGWISFSIKVEHSQNKGRITIQVEDSGTGFSQNQLSIKSDSSAPRYHGRGIPVLRELCDLIEFNEPGNKTRVIYSWDRITVNHSESSIQAE